ncbi:MAG: BatA domain-containing protein [Bacteroidales bacterium]|nr:BatA domain-containing protein [Bacteroidales bacterium]
MQFLNPLFLYGLLALSLPVIIHLFNFRRYRKVYFTNVALLKNIKSETKRQSKLRSIILLIIRLLTITCIVMAFAQPYIPYQGGDGAMKKETIQAIYCDNSMSMEKISGPTNIFTEARLIAEDIIHQNKSGHTFFISDNESSESYRRRYGQADALMKLSSLETGPEVLTIGEVIRRQQMALSEFPDAGKNLLLISDFQKSSFTLPDNRIDSSLKVFLIPVVSPESGNVFIDSVWFTSPLQLHEQMSHIGFRLQNRSQQKLQAFKVKLFRNDLQAGIASVDAEPENFVISELAIFNDQAGIHHYYLEIEDKLSPYDNKFFFTTQVHQEISVLHIGGSKTSAFLKKFYKAEKVFSYDASETGKLQFSRIPDNDFVILDGLEIVPNGLSAQLKTHLENGGSAAIFPPVNADINSYSLLFQQLEISLFMKPDTGNNLISGIQKESSLFKDALLEIPENPIFPGTDFHFSMRYPKNASVRSLLKLANGDDFLLEYSIGKGKVYLFACQLIDENTDFHRNPLFIPCAYNMPLSIRNDQSPYLIVGSNNHIQIKYRGNSAAEIIRIKSLDNKEEFIPIIRMQSGYMMIQPGPGIRKAGNYLVYGTEGNISSLAFNIDRRESAPECYSADELNSMIKTLGLSNFYVLADGKNPVGTQIERINQGKSFWKFLLLLALIFIVSEVLLLRFWK